jgi:hypothetical protein
VKRISSIQHDSRENLWSKASSHGWKNVSMIGMKSYIAFSLVIVSADHSLNFGSSSSTHPRAGCPHVCFLRPVVFLAHRRQLLVHILPLSLRAYHLPYHDLTHTTAHKAHSLEYPVPTSNGDWRNLRRY